VSRPPEQTPVGLQLPPRGKFGYLADSPEAFPATLTG
jgi:hypothetical protein